MNMQAQKRYIVDKHQDILVETILAGSLEVDFDVVLSAKQNYCKNINIFTYEKILKLQKLVKYASSGASYEEIKKYISSIGNLTENESKLLSMIIESWYKNSILKVAMPKNIKRYKTQKIDFEEYVNSIVARRVDG